MSPTVAVTVNVHSRLRQLARFSGCDENAVIERLLDNLLIGDSAETSGHGRHGSKDSNESRLHGRAPRERGARVRLGSETHHVQSVRELFETVLRYLAKHGKNEKLKGLTPYKTSSQRYLVANKPVHPNGNAFFAPVNHGEFFMEAHKSYSRAVTDLQELLTELDVAFEYVSG